MSGSTIGGVVGGLVGLSLGYPQAGYMIGSAIGGYVDPDVIEGPRMGDGQQVTANEGVARPFGYGTFVVHGHVIQCGELDRKTVRTRPGKGGPAQENERGYMTFALALCEGPIKGVQRIWWNKKLVYSTRAGDEIEGDSQKLASIMTIYLGDETQMPDPVLEALPPERGGGVGNTPAYRGLSYLRINGLDVTETGGALGDWMIEVVGDGEITTSQYPRATSINKLAGISGAVSGADLEVLTWPLTLGPINQIKIDLGQTLRVKVIQSSATVYDSGWLASNQVAISDTAFSSYMAGVSSIKRDGVTTNDPKKIDEQMATLSGDLKTIASEVTETFRASYGAGAIVMYRPAFTNLSGGTINVKAANVPDGIILPEKPSLIYSNGSFISYPWEPLKDVSNLTANNVAVSQIVQDIAERVGLPVSKLDTSQLTDEVRGYSISKQMTATKAIEPLQAAYFFDMPEWDGKIRGIKRGGAAVVTLTDDDALVEQRGEDDNTRAQAIEFPRKVNIIAPDPEANYEPAKETAQRLSSDVRAVGEVTVEAPIIFTSRDEQAQIAQKTIKTKWAEATGRQTQWLPPEFSRLCPSDCYIKDGRRYRITQAEYEGGKVKLNAVRDRANAYTSAATGTPTITPAKPVSTLRGPTIFHVMCLPRAIEKRLGIHVAAHGMLDGWQGAEIQISYDSGATYNTVATITTPATMGKLTSNITASTSPIPVQMTSGTLESVTNEQIAAQMNGLAIGRTRPEVAQVKTVTASGADTYDLTDVSRGLLGSAIHGHLNGDRVVLLDSALVFIPINEQHVGKTIFVRGVSIGTAPENADVIPIVFEPYVIEPSASASRAFELTYHELRKSNTAAQIDALNSGSYVGVLGDNPNGEGGAQEFVFSAAKEGSQLINRGSHPWASHAEVVESSKRRDKSFTLAKGEYLQHIAVGDPALWGDEWVKVEAWDESTNQITLGRGCLHTPPVEHTAGERIWFATHRAAVDPTIYNQGTDVTVDVTPKVYQGTPTSLARWEHFTAAVPHLPYPPGDVKINGQTEEPIEVIGDLDVSWSIRDKATIDNIIIDTEAANQGASQLVEVKATAIIEPPPSGTYFPATHTMTNSGDTSQTSVKGRVPFNSDIYIHVKQSGAQSSQSHLFRASNFHPANENQAVYSAHDWSKLWQDVAGTIPVTAYGQKVARVDSLRVGHPPLLQATVSRQPILQDDGDGLSRIHFSPSNPGTLECDITLHGAQQMFLAVAHQTPSSWVYCGWGYAYSGTTGGFYIAISKDVDRGAQFGGYPQSTPTQMIAYKTGYTGQKIVSAGAYRVADKTMRTWADGVEGVSSVVGEGDTTKINAANAKLVMGNNLPGAGSARERNYYGLIASTADLSPQDWSRNQKWLGQLCGKLL